MSLGALILGFACSYSIRLVFSLFHPVGFERCPLPTPTMLLHYKASTKRCDWASNKSNCNVTNWLLVKIHFQSTDNLRTRGGLDWSRSNCAKSTHAKMCASANGIELDRIAIEVLLRTGLMLLFLSLAVIIQWSRVQVSVSNQEQEIYN